MKRLLIIPVVTLASIVSATMAVDAAVTVSGDLLNAGSNNDLLAMHMETYGVQPVISATNSGMLAVGFYHTLRSVGSASIGYHNTVWMENSLALGKWNLVGEERSSRNGIGNSMVIGQSNHVEGPNSLLIGESNSTSFDYVWDGDEGARRNLVVGSWNSSGSHDSIIVGTNNSINDVVEGWNYPWPAENAAVFGKGLISKYDNCLVVGKNNVGTYTPQGESPPLFIIGNGTATSSRADALVVKSNGDIIISKPQGDINMGIYGDD